MKIAFITPQGKRDYLVETVLEGFHQLGHELIVSDPGNGFCDARMTDDTFVEAANRCDLVIACFGKVRNNAPPRHYLLSQIHQSRERKAYICGSEWRADGWDTPEQVAGSLVDPRLRRGEPWLNEDMRKECGFYFKRECYPDDLTRGVIPLPFALREKHILRSNAPRDIDVLCSFSHTKTGLRKEAIEVAQSLAGELNVVVKTGMSESEYRDTLTRSRFVIDCWGGGDICDRFWDAVGSGACVLYQRYNIVMSDPFIDDVHAVSFTTSWELRAAIQELDVERVAEIGKRGLEHALRYHTAQHRAQRILDSVFSK